MLIIADPRDLRVQKLRAALFEHDIGVCDATGGEDASTVHCADRCRCSVDCQRGLMGGG